MKSDRSTSGRTAIGQPGALPSRPVKRSFSLSGHRTSISLEAAFWDALKDAAAAEGVSLAQLVGRIDLGRGAAGLSGAVRVWMLDYYRRGGATADPSGHPTESVSRRGKAARGAAEAE